MFSTVSGGEDAGPNISPGAIVEGLFLYVSYVSVMWMEKICTRSYLTPKDIGIGVCIEVRSNLGNDTIKRGLPELARRQLTKS